MSVQMQENKNNGQPAPGQQIQAQPLPTPVKWSLGVTVIGYLHIIFGAIAGLGAIALLIAGLFFTAALNNLQGDQALLGNVLAAFALFIGGVLLVIALAYVVVGVGLIRRRQWARIVTLVITGLSAASCVAAVFDTQLFLSKDVFAVLVNVGYCVSVFAILLNPRNAAEFQTQEERTHSSGYLITAGGKTYWLPREEHFWKRYSPNHEFPLSGTLSLALFCGALALLVLSINFNWFGNKIEPPSTGAIALDGPMGDGGDDGQNGQGGDGRPITGPPGKKENLTGDQDPFSKDLPPPPRLDDIPHPPVDESVKAEIPNQDFVDNPTLAVISFAGVEKDIRQVLTRALPKGPSGTSDGGTGKVGKPGKPGRPGTGTRADRVLRWNIILDTRSGNNYLTELRFLKAFVGKPERVAANMVQFRIFRNLTRIPVRGEIEDPATIDRFYAIDSKPESVRALADALGLSGQLTHLVIFLPRDVEEDLYRKELAYRGTPEDRIAETQFRGLWRGRKYEFQVTDQRVK